MGSRNVVQHDNMLSDNPNEWSTALVTLAAAVASRRPGPRLNFKLNCIFSVCCCCDAGAADAEDTRQTGLATDSEDLVLVQFFTPGNG